MEDRLRYIYAMVHEHLRFAEAKNAALLAANAATLVGTLNVLSDADSRHLGQLLQGYLWCVVIASCTSGILILLSFLPQTHIPWLKRKRGEPRDGNVFFFGHIQRHDPAGYLSAVFAAYGEPVRQFTQAERHFAEQIVVNARIASRKFFYFKLAIWATLAGVVTPFFAGLLALVVLDRHEGS